MTDAHSDLQLVATRARASMFKSILLVVAVCTLAGGGYYMAVQRATLADSPADLAAQQSRRLEAGHPAVVPLAPAPAHLRDRGFRCGNFFAGSETSSTRQQVTVSLDTQPGEGLR